MLEVRDVHAAYSGIVALRGVSLRLDEGEMVALVGPNGAGKSTLLNVISGIVPAASGTVSFEGVPIGGATPWSIARRGLLQVPEGRQVLPQMTVLENLEVGATARGERAVTYDLERIYGLFPILKERRWQLAGSLSGGQQQMLAIGRALMGSPRLLLLDEPSLGLAPVIVRQVFDALAALKRDGLTILLVEQNARLALEATDRALVLEGGSVVHEGASAALARDPDVIAHYLGQAA